MANGEELGQAVFGGAPPAAVAPGAPPAGQPGAAQPGVMPPKDENDLMQRVAGWRAVIDRLANDPVSQQAILRFGTALMRPVEPGNTRAGHIAGAIDVGATTAQAMTNEQVQQATAAAETKRRAEETASQGRLRSAQTSSIEQRLPVELESIRAQVRHANSQSELLAVDTRIKNLEAQLKTQFGARAAEAEIAKLRSESGYRDAMARYADAHARQARAIAGGLENDWQTQPTHDPTGNLTGYIASNRKTNERQVTRITQPMPMAEAVAQAKQDVNAVKGRIAGFWGGGEPREQVLQSLTGDPSVQTEEQAVKVLTDRYVKGGVTTQRFDRDGKPLGVLTDADTQKPAATTAPPAGGAPIVSDLMPVPPQWKHYPPGTKVENKRDGEWYEIAAGGMRKTAPPVTGAAATTPAPVEGDTTNRKYTRQKVRGTWRYTYSPRIGKTMEEWAAIDAAQEE